MLLGNPKEDDKRDLRHQMIRRRSVGRKGGRVWIPSFLVISVNRYIDHKNKVETEKTERARPKRLAKRANEYEGVAPSNILTCANMVSISCKCLCLETLPTALTFPLSASAAESARLGVLFLVMPSLPLLVRRDGESRSTLSPVCRSSKEERTDGTFILAVCTVLSAPPPPPLLPGTLLSPSLTACPYEQPRINKNIGAEDCVRRTETQLPRR